MVKRNPHFAKLSPSYLFAEVARRKKGLENLISLSIGDTSEPIPSPVTEALQRAAAELGARATYSGYGPEQGDARLREKIAERLYDGMIEPDEIFISDGAKCDIGRLQLLFDSEQTLAVQNPTYPVYVDTGLLHNQRIVYLDCRPENGFFPEALPEADVLFLCSPNNPTGTTLTHAQLARCVAWAQKRGALIIYDAAYAGFIQDPTLPRSIYEIEGAERVAIEVSSFSKLIGFTGVRLGWSVLPRALKYPSGESVHADYQRIVTTFFNGASNLAQAGGIVALDYLDMCRYYLENAHLLKRALEAKGVPVYGGENAPYLWVDFGERSSWDLFQLLIEETGVITTPGSGFGSCGEGFLRFSAFGSRDTINEAIKRIETRWPASLALLPT